MMMMMMRVIADKYMTLSSQTLIRTTSNAWLKADKLFPEIDNTCRKCWEISETIQHITGACHTLALGDYTHRHSQGANIVHQELAVKCGLL